MGLEGVGLRAFFLYRLLTVLPRGLWGSLLEALDSTCLRMHAHVLHACKLTYMHTYMRMGGIFVSTHVYSLCLPENETRREYMAVYRKWRASLISSNLLSNLVSLFAWLFEFLEFVDQVELLNCSSHEGPDPKSNDHLGII